MLSLGSEKRILADYGSEGVSKAPWPELILLGCRLRLSLDTGPVPPDAVYELVRQGAQVLVQPCDRRIWPNDEFVKVGLADRLSHVASTWTHPSRQAGAILHSTLAPANILVGIKETPISQLDALKAPVNGRERTHVMFSHTAKGQMYNMPLLSRFVDDSGGDMAPRLVDYELLTGPDGKRVVGFGWFAGGTIAETPDAG